MMRPQLPTHNPFDEAYTDFEQTALYQRLADKFTPKAYYIRYRALRVLALVGSYLFNVFSAMTASVTVYFFVYRITAHHWAATGATLGFIGLLEAAKRTTASRLFQNALQYKKWAIGLTAIMVGFMALSLVFSYRGATQGVSYFTPTPTPINADSLTAYHRSQIAAIDEQIRQARTTTYKGTTTRTSQQTIQALTEQKAALESAALTIEQDTRTANRQTTTQHRADTTVQAHHFALFTLLLEFLFLLSAWYLEYYDFRSYAEFAEPNMTAVSQRMTNGTPQPKSLADATTLEHGKGKNDVPTSVINKAKKEVQKQMASAKYRLRNGIGKASTSEKNIAKAQAELDELQALLNQKQHQNGASTHV